MNPAFSSFMGQDRGFRKNELKMKKMIVFLFFFLGVGVVFVAGGASPSLPFFSSILAFFSFSFFLYMGSFFFFLRFGGGVWGFTLFSLGVFGTGFFFGVRGGWGGF